MVNKNDTFAQFTPSEVGFPNVFELSYSVGDMTKSKKVVRTVVSCFDYIQQGFPNSFTKILLVGFLVLVFAPWLSKNTPGGGIAHSGKPWYTGLLLPQAIPTNASFKILEISCYLRPAQVSLNF